VLFYHHNEKSLPLFLEALPLEGTACDSPVIDTAMPVDWINPLSSPVLDCPPRAVRCSVPSPCRPMRLRVWVPQEGWQFETVSQVVRAEVTMTCEKNQVVNTLI
jgi:hypothetical protein